MNSFAKTEVGNNKTKIMSVFFIKQFIAYHEVSCKSPAKILISLHEELHEELHEVIYKSHIKSDILDLRRVTERPYTMI